MVEKDQRRIAIISGANRGLGFETARQLARLGIRVILTSRHANKGQTAQERLAHEGLEVLFHPLDVTDETSIATLGQFVRSRCGRVDVLINNAGVFLDGRNPEESGSSVFNLSVNTLQATLKVNLFGALLLIQELMPLMRQQNYGRIVNVSSGLGQLSDMQGRWAAYRMSKTALNALTRIVAAEIADQNILINSVCPGWVRTDLGGANAERSVEEGADTIVWAATLPDDGPNGGFFRDRQPLAW